MTRKLIAKYFLLYFLSLFVVPLNALPNIAASPSNNPEPSQNKNKKVQDKPNIIVIFGDDIGQTNLSIYSHGLMGYFTPNIDRIGKEGMLFTDFYAEQSCTAGRSAFITGQSVFRTGLTKVGVPGSNIGISKQDPTIAELLKPLGYTTGQFGKNHLGDRDEFLPTNHGFDEFYGNLYHLNAEEAPESPDYPKASEFPNFPKNYGPRGVIHSWVDDKGGQKVVDTGPLDRKRMETIDDDITKRTVEFMKKHHKEGPLFIWVNFTHMHFRTHAKPESIGQAGRWQSEYHDVMVDHDKNVGTILNALDELGISNNTIVIYSTDNGPHENSWPDAGTTPFRSEKDTNWEGAFRVPLLLRWPEKIKAGSISNEIMAHLDWLPTFIAVAGDPNIKEELLKGYKIDSMIYNVHLDGYNFLPYLTGEIKESPRKEFFYFSDDGDLLALRFSNWKFVFAEQRAQGTLRIWLEPFIKLRAPKLFNLRTDPFERADITSNTYYDWLLSHAFLMLPVQDYVKKFILTFKKYPPRQKSASFTIDQVLEMLQKGEKN
ncbi:MAG: arylsulfatase [Alphaproteobacteria bacterium]|nr:arylsulfatase [Alphaproteobacteria bacterium]